jgi:hypothetical protein
MAFTVTVTGVSVDVHNGAPPEPVITTVPSALFNASETNVPE